MCFAQSDSFTSVRLDILYTVEIIRQRNESNIYTARSELCIYIYMFDSFPD